MSDPFYRYFLGFRPDHTLRRYIAAVARKAGQRFQPELSHLTLCVIEEAAVRDLFLHRRVDAALASRALHSFCIFLGRVQGNDHGAAVRTIGSQDGIQDFYQMLVRLLAVRGISPLYRKSGLHPHLTLGYAASRFDPFKIAVEWFPNELLLIESEVGNGKHQVIGRWPLLPSPQGSLPFEMPVQGWRLAG